jgi:hypothetical protein
MVNKIPKESLDMEKKLIVSAIASAVAMSAVLPALAKNPNSDPPAPLLGPLDEVYCAQAEDGVDAGWYDPAGDDYFNDDTKYGGDLEVDADLVYWCEAAEEEASFGGSETATVDVDLSRDESAPFFYSCEPGGESATCAAHIDWEDLEAIVNEAAADRFNESSEAAENCNEVEGTLYTWGATLDGVATFGVKEMNPGHGNGKQNYQKTFETCELDVEDPS